ncbi:MAG: hypothetical protein LBC92_02085 [Rickettsiales bacterium]|jgi:hypothetical protein|nr:hypothetical protein [Rickettsiales bacterium]
MEDSQISDNKSIAKKISDEIVSEYKEHIQDLTDEVLQQEIDKRLCLFIENEKPDWKIDDDLGSLKTEAKNNNATSLEEMDIGFSIDDEGADSDNISINNSNVATDLENLEVETKIDYECDDENLDISDKRIIKDFPSLNKGVKDNIKDTFTIIKEAFGIGGGEISVGERLIIFILLILPAIVGGLFLCWFWVVLFVLWQIYNYLQKMIDYLRKHKDNIKNKITEYWRKIKTGFGSGNFLKILLSTALFSVIFFNGMMYLCIRGMMVPLQSMAQLNRFLSNLSAKAVNLVANITKGPVAMVKRGMGNMLGFNALSGKNVVKSKQNAKQNMKMQALKRQIMALRKQQQKGRQVQEKITIKKQEKIVQQKVEKQKQISKEIQKTKGQIKELVGEKQIDIRTMLILEQKNLNALKSPIVDSKGQNGIGVGGAGASLKGGSKSSPMTNDGFSGVDIGLSVAPKLHLDKIAEVVKGIVSIEPRIPIQEAGKPVATVADTTIVRINDQSAAVMNNSLTRLSAISNNGITTEDVRIAIATGRDGSSNEKSYTDIAKDLGLSLNTPEEQYEAALHFATYRDAEENKGDNLDALKKWKEEHPELANNEMAISQERVDIANRDSMREYEQFKNSFGFDLKEEINNYRASNPGLNSPMTDEQFKQFSISTAKNHPEINDKVGMMEAMHEQNMAFKQEQRMKERVVKIQANKKRESETKPPESLVNRSGSSTSIGGGRSV